MRVFSFIKRALMKIIKIFKINRLVYRISPNLFLDIDSKKVDEARNFLELHSPNPKTSCFCKNNVNIQTDLHIIIPAYNVEKYIKQCLDSVVISPSKKYTYCVTVINDGSDDKTELLLHSYQNDPNIEIINQQNKGFSGARNTGLKNIKGKYIFFLDSDDCLDWGGVEKLLDVAFETNAEVVAGSHTNIDSIGNKKEFCKKRAGILDTTQLGGQPWAKVFKAELFSNVCFPEKYWYEDSILAQIIYPKVKYSYGIGENTYFYRIHSNSISFKGKSKIKSIDSYWITEQLFYEREKIGLEITEKYYNYILRMVKLTFSRIMLQSDEVKKSVFVLFVDFISKNFEGYSTSDKNLKEIEKIIKTKNFGKCVAYSKWR